MPTVIAEEKPLEDHYAVFRMDNGGLTVRKVRGSVVRTFTSLTTKKVISGKYHIVEGHGNSFWAEEKNNFLTILEIDPDSRRHETMDEWLMREVRTTLNEWIV